MPAMQPPAIKSDDVSKDEFTGRMAGNPPVNPASAGYDERFPRNNCFQNARWMVLMHPELIPVEGYLVFTDHDGQEYPLPHAWNETPDGQRVDSTAWAFEDVLPYRYERDPRARERLVTRAEELNS
jgi:hypothetical protein